MFNPAKILWTEQVYFVGVAITTLYIVKPEPIINISPHVIKNIISN